MAIDVDKKRPILANNTGGLSGPAIKPIAVRMVHDIYHAVKIPVMGLGGIMTGDDAVEFLLAGASAISVGTGNFHSPDTSIKVVEGIESYMVRNKIDDIKDVIGALTLN